MSKQFTQEEWLPFSDYLAELTDGEEIEAIKFEPLYCPAPYDGYREAPADVLLTAAEAAPYIAQPQRKLRAYWTDQNQNCIAWTRSWVIFTASNEGEAYLDRVPRHPVAGR